MTAVMHIGALRRTLGWALLVTLVTGTAYVAALWWSWSRVDRFPFDIAAARTELGLAPSPVAANTRSALLVVGTDARPSRYREERADAVMLLIRSAGDGSIGILSIPRDLEVSDPCGGEPLRLNALLSACRDGVVAGPERIAVSVEDLTGVPITHAAMFRFEGFERLIDGLGGVDICVDRPTAVVPGGRPLVDAGCRRRSGAAAVLWARSRVTLQQIGDRWRPAADGDVGRIDRQQELVLAVVDRILDPLAGSSLQGLAALAAATVAVDDGFGVREAAGLARAILATPPEEIRRATLAVARRVDGQGGGVILADEPQLVVAALMG